MQPLGDRPQLRVRDAGYVETAPVTGAWSLDVVLRLNYTSSWTLTLPVISGPPDQAAAYERAREALEQQPSGIVLRAAGSSPDEAVTLLSGTTTEMQRDVTDAGDVWTVTGDDDMAVLDVAAWPVPSGTIGGQTSPQYRVTTNAEDAIHRFVAANLGPSSARYLPQLAMGDNLGRGPTGTWAARMTSLLDVIRRPAESAGLGFRVGQAGAGLRFETFAPVDRSADVRFRAGGGGLAGYTYTRRRATVTDVVVGGAGAGASRLFRRASSAEAFASLGYRIEQFIDAGDTTDTAEMDQQAADALREGRPLASMSLAVTDTPTLKFGTHYGLGDKVTAELPSGVQVVDAVREVHLTYSESGVSVTPLVGPDGSIDPETDDVQNRRVEELARRIAALEGQR